MVGAAEDEDLNQLVEDDAVGDARAMTAEGMGDLAATGSRAANWSQMGSMMDDGNGGHGSAPHTESLKTFPSPDPDVGTSDTCARVTLGEGYRAVRS